MKKIFVGLIALFLLTLGCAKEDISAYEALQFIDSEVKAVFNTPADQILNAFPNAALLNSLSSEVTKVYLIDTNFYRSAYVQNDRVVSISYALELEPRYINMFVQELVKRYGEPKTLYEGCYLIYPEECLYYIKVEITKESDLYLGYFLLNS